MKKLTELQKKNTALLKKYNGDAKFARVHKRINEENETRKTRGKKPLISVYDGEVLNFLTYIKGVIDQKVYDRNDILRKDEYFAKTVMQQIMLGFDELNFSSERDDRLFIQSRLTTQYMNQYNAVYA